jgi:phosphoribosylformimino-5-aminoimidazole carboxamide ribotide isomerase
MIIYPAIDLKDGQCVRLVRGDMDTATAYNDDPAAQANIFARDGFSWIHVVDLNGAVEGKPVNVDAVRAIVNAADIPVQLGGGIRTFAQVRLWLEEGVSRVILGTAAVKDPALVRESCRAFPGQIVLGLDASQGNVATEGWAEGSDISLLDLARSFEDAGAAAIIYTDIERDGTGDGLNIDMTATLAAALSIPVIASGGTKNMDDLQKLKDAALTAPGIEGIIIGRAFYDGSLDKKQALAFFAAKE